MCLKEQIYQKALLPAAERNVKFVISCLIKVTETQYLINDQPLLNQFEYLKII